MSSISSLLSCVTSRQWIDPSTRDWHECSDNALHTSHLCAADISGNKFICAWTVRKTELDFCCQDWPLQSCPHAESMRTAFGPNTKQQTHACEYASRWNSVATRHLDMSDINSSNRWVFAPQTFGGVRRSRHLMAAHHRNYIYLQLRRMMFVFVGSLAKWRSLTHDRSDR